jgi:hypothetical protein
MKTIGKIITRKIFYCFYFFYKNSKKEKLKRVKHMKKLLGEANEEEKIKRTKLQRGEDGKPLPIQKRVNFSNTGVRELSFPLN